MYRTGSASRQVPGTSSHAHRSSHPTLSSLLRPQTSERGGGSAKPGGRPSTTPTAPPMFPTTSSAFIGTDPIFTLSGGVTRTNTMPPAVPSSAMSSGKDTASALPPRRRIFHTPLGSAGGTRSQSWASKGTSTAQQEMKKSSDMNTTIPGLVKKSSFVESLRSKLFPPSSSSGVRRVNSIVLSKQEGAMGDDDEEDVPSSPIESRPVTPPNMEEPSRATTTIIEEIVSRSAKRKGSFTGVLNPVVGEGERPVGVGIPQQQPTAEMYRAKGNTEYENMRYREAIQLYSKAIDLSSTQGVKPSYFTNRAAAHFMLCEYDACVKDCLQAVTLDGQNVKAHARMAKAYMLLGQLKMARRHYEAARSSPQASESQRDTIDGEVEALQYLEEYRRAFDSCNFNQALEFVVKAQAKIPDCMPIVLMRLHTTIHIDPVDARAQLTQHLDEKSSGDSALNAHRAEFLHLMAKACFYCGNHYIDVAKTYAQQAVANSTQELKQCHYLLKTITFVDKRIHEAHRSYQEGKWAEAAASYTLAATADPLNHRLRSVLYCNRAASNLMLGNVVEAIRDCSISITADESNARAYARRSRGYEELGEWDKALRDMESAARVQEVFQEDLKELRSRWQKHEQQQNAQRPHPPKSGYPRGGGGGGGSSSHNSHNSQPPMAFSYYELLGIEQNADVRIIRKRYHELTLTCHPDKCVGKSPKEKQELEERFKEITKMYVTLTDPKLRTEYDASLLCCPFQFFSESTY